MSKFSKAYKTIMEEIGGYPMTDIPLRNELCDLDHLYRWTKGKANVYACLITDENAKLSEEFLHRCRENQNKKVKIGQYIVYNPNIPEDAGQVWMNKLSGYSKASFDNSAFNGKLKISEGGLDFEEYVFIPKIDNLEDGVDTWVGFEIPKGMTFKIEEGCGNNGSDGSSAFETDWLPIVNGKFDWARSLASMRQSNFTCEGSINKSEIHIDQKCIDSWNEQSKNM